MRAPLGGGIAVSRVARSGEMYSHRCELREAHFSAASNVTGNPRDERGSSIAWNYVRTSPGLLRARVYE
jgi:hypothetical protein